MAANRKKEESFSYTFAALRGTQAGREYYVAMCPLKLIPKIFLFDEEELPADMRAQRSLNRARVPEIARYLVLIQRNMFFPQSQPRWMAAYDLNRGTTRDHRLDG